MPSSPTPQTSSPTRRSDKGKFRDAPRTPPKPKPHVPSSPRRTQSYTPQTPHSSPPHASARAAPPRRHTSQPVRSTRSPRLSGVLAQASKPSPSRKRTFTSPIPTSQGEPHVLIPVPIRAKDAQSPSFIRTPSGQHVDFVFSPPKKRGLISRLLDSVEWGDSHSNKPYRFRKLDPDPSSSRPFYKKILS